MRDIEVSLEPRASHGCAVVELGGREVVVVAGGQVHCTALLEKICWRSSGKVFTN